MSCSFRDFDYGIDVTLHEITRRDNRYAETGFTLDIQAKSTVNAILEAEWVKYDLEVKNYNDSRDDMVGTPRILVLLLLPEHEADWTAMTEEQLLLRRCAYWSSLKGREPTPNQDTIRVAIPQRNRFSPEALQAVMRKVQAGEEL